MATVEAIISKAGFELLRNKNHRIYRNAAGQNLVTAATPSDWRAGRNTLAQLSRLTGVSLRTLTVPTHRKRIRIPAPEPIRIVASQVVPETLPAAVVVPPAPLTAAEGKLLKRMVKHEAQYVAKQAKQLERFIRLVHMLTALFDSDEVFFENEDYESRLKFVIGTVFIHVKHSLGFQDVELMSAAVKDSQEDLGFLVVRVGTFYLDVACDTVRTGPTWTEEGFGEVEIEGGLIVREDGKGGIDGWS